LLQSMGSKKTIDNLGGNIEKEFLKGLKNR
jgi:hypothetical protein